MYVYNVCKMVLCTQDSVMQAVTHCTWSVCQGNTAKAVKDVQTSPRHESKTMHSSFKYKGVEYQVGDSVFLPPGTLNFKHKAKDFSKTAEHREKNYDEDMYPELYRKFKSATEYIKGSNLECPKPFEIGEYLGTMYSTVELG